jgi:CheY-like chemotaxis protein
MSKGAKTVLIADDDDLILASCKFSLERKGYRVLLAAHGGEALAQIGLQPVDAVFLDILMPHQEGLETLIEMRRQFPDIPIFVMTGGWRGSGPDFLSIAQKFGASGIIRKPLTPAAMINLIEGLPQKGTGDSTTKSA